MQNQSSTDEPQGKLFQCSHCIIKFKSKLSLFAHLSSVHGFDVDGAVRDAGLKLPGINNPNADSTGSTSKSQDLFNTHEKEPETLKEQLIVCQTPEININVISANQHMEDAASKSESQLEGSKDVKSYIKSMQTVTKYFTASSGSNGKLKSTNSSVLQNSTSGTIVLQESPSSFSPNSSGVFKVTAKSLIDITKKGCDRFMQNERLLNLAGARRGRISEQYPNDAGKRICSESVKNPLAKKAKQEPTNIPQSSSSSEFDLSETEKEVEFVNGDAKSPNVYSCKLCAFSDESVRHMSTHYQNHHPYVCFNSDYIKDPSDRSATFRCLMCPIEFVSVSSLKKHFMENHINAPDIFKLQLCDLSLVFKCFVCQFKTDALPTLKEHYNDSHPNHNMHYSLMYCRYLVTNCEEEPPQSDTCEKSHSSELSRSTPESRKCEVIKKEPSSQHPISKEDVSLYHCSCCDFSHKSIVVMHVHYQKSHPDKTVSIKEIKQSAVVTSHTVTPEKMPEASNAVIDKPVAKKKTPDSSMEAKDKLKMPQQNFSASEMNVKHSMKSQSISLKKKVESTEDRKEETPAKSHSSMSTKLDSSPDRVFHCKFCKFSSTNIKSVVSHHNAKHTALTATCIEDIVKYTNELQSKTGQSETEASASTTSFEYPSSEQVKAKTEKEPQHEESDTPAMLVTKLNPYSRPEDLFYCAVCNFGSPTAIGVRNHQTNSHHRCENPESIIKYTALVRDQIEKSKSEAKEPYFSSNLPLPLVKDDDIRMFFCHHCNFRQSSIAQIIHHYHKRHRGFTAKTHEIHSYSNMIYERLQKLNLQRSHQGSVGENENKASTTQKSLSVPGSSSVTKKTLKCNRCTYSTPQMYLLRRHIRKCHRDPAASAEVSLKQRKWGYQCDLCSFFHKKSAIMYKHYRKHHPGRKPSLEFITSHLYVSPESTPLHKKKPKIKDTEDFDDVDSSLPFQMSGQNETKTYSCRACSFKDNSVESITNHYRAVHPWSVKEDGSVPDVISRRKSSANKQDDDDDTPVSFDSYQVPLELENSPASSNEATPSSVTLKCAYCSARFYTLHGLNTHCGMKHANSAPKHLLVGQEEEDEESGARVHIFKCPYCTYVNTVYQGVLTHSQMKHPTQTARADSLHISEAQLKNMDHGWKKRGWDDQLTFRGYMCKICPQIYATQQRLNQHYERDHDHLAPETSKSLIVRNKQHLQTHKTKGSILQHSLLKKKYSKMKCQLCNHYCCTKIAMNRHLLMRHKKGSLSVMQDRAYRCVLCSNIYFRKKRLGSHYATKHGEEAFLKYYLNTYEKLAKTSVDGDSALHPQNTSEECASSTATDKNKILVYRCPSCPYVNSSHHGTLTHCQMIHPNVLARADKLQTDEILVANMIKCPMGRSANQRGYMCKRCPEIYASRKKLKIHSEKVHARTVAKAANHLAEKEPEKPPESKTTEDHDIQLTYRCSHCTYSTSMQESLAYHYKKTHGKDVFVKYFNEVLQQTHWKMHSSSLGKHLEKAKSKDSLYRCHICPYRALFRRYLSCHYRKTHNLDGLTTSKLLKKYNKRKVRNLSEREDKARLKCKTCPKMFFDSSQQVINHYRSFHHSECKTDFIVIYQQSKRTTGVFKCTHCQKKINGVKKLYYHLDHHRKRNNHKAERRRQAALISPSPPEAQTSEQDELAGLETTAEMTERVVTEEAPSSADEEQREPESRRDGHTCSLCARTFRSRKVLSSHERGHIALAALKKRNILPTSIRKHNLNKYVLYKSWTKKPFQCTLCSYRTHVKNLLMGHFMKKHQDVMNPPESGENEKNAQTADKEPPNSSDTWTSMPEPDDDSDSAEESNYWEPPAVRQQLNQFSFMVQNSASTKATAQETALANSSLLRCELCNFSSGHLASFRRHYLNRHGKKLFKCKDCDFYTGVRKTLEMHLETAHSTSQSKPLHHRDFRCPFCLYQTGNKNNMIDHIILHREERVVPIEVRRPKLSRYLRGIVFRCHKCTFTSASAENLRSHMMKHDDVKPYKCCLCYFDCTQLCDLKAHLCDKHQVVRNHKLVGQISLDQLEEKFGRIPEEEQERPLVNLQHHDDESENEDTEDDFANYNEVSQETQVKNLSVNVPSLVQEKKLELDDDKDAKGLNLRDKISANTTVQEQLKQEPHEMLLTDTEGGKDSDILIQDCNISEKVRQMNADQPRDCADSRMMVQQQKSQGHRLQLKALRDKTLNIEARVEDDILRHILLLDQGSSIRSTRRPRDRTVSVKNVGSEAINVSQIIVQDERSSFTKNPFDVKTEVIQATTKKHPKLENDIRSPGCFTAERLLSLTPVDKERLGVSLKNCKKTQVCITERYGEMPSLDRECLQEETSPLGRCKEEEQNDKFELKRDRDKTNEKQCRDQQDEEGDGMKQADGACVVGGAVAVDGAAEVLRSSLAEEKFTCELCGRNLTSGSELERHITRHRL